MVALRSISMTLDAFDATRHDCPICGKRLVKSVANMVPRMERDGNGNLEVVQVYLCFFHGYYTFRRSEGLKQGI